MAGTDEPRIYPHKRDLLILVRDVLDGKPQAVDLAKSIAGDFKAITLAHMVNVIDGYVRQIEEAQPHLH